MTVQSNPDKLFLKYDDDNDEIDNIDLMANDLQTIVEVVNPLILGDGNPNEIVTSKGSNSLEDEFYSGNSMQSLESNIRKPELSLNAKMKNVLQELVENERVKLRLSQSIDDEEDDDDEEEEDDDDDEEDEDDFDENFDKDQATSFYDSYYDNLNAGSFVVDGCQVYQNPNTENILETTTTTTSSNITNTTEEDNERTPTEGKDNIVDETLLSELNVTNNSPLAVEGNVGNLEKDLLKDDGDGDIDVDAEDVEDEPNGLTSNEDTVIEQHQQMSSPNKSGISNNKKKNKRKNKNKRK